MSMSAPVTVANKAQETHNFIAKEFVAYNKDNYSSSRRNAIIAGIIAPIFLAITALGIALLITRPELVHSAPFMAKLGFIGLGTTIAAITTFYHMISNTRSALRSKELMNKDKTVDFKDHTEFQQLLLASARQYRKLQSTAATYETALTLCEHKLDDKRKVERNDENTNIPNSSSVIEFTDSNSLP